MFSNSAAYLCIVGGWVGRLLGCVVHLAHAVSSSFLDVTYSVLRI